MAKKTSVRRPGESTHPRKKKKKKKKVRRRNSESPPSRPNGNGRSVEAGQGVYDENAIQTLDALEHIRLRTGMYIGRIGDGTHPQDGIYIMLKEVIDNGIDEFIMGHGKKIQIELGEAGMSVRDYGRGIPLGKVVECVSQINTGGKYNHGAAA